MSRRYKVLASVLAVVFSLAAAGLGYGLIGATTFSFSLRFLCNFVFLTQFIATTWIVIVAFRKENK